MLDAGALAVSTGIALAAGDAAVGEVAFPMLPGALAVPAWALLFVLVGAAGWLVWRREGLGLSLVSLGALMGAFALRAPLSGLGLGPGASALLLGLITLGVAHLLARRGQRGPALLSLPLAVAFGALALA